MISRQRAIEVVTRLQKSGHIAYFAGGCVRDMLLKIPSEDYDVATSASVEEICALFEKTLTVGAHFGVVIVLFKGEKIEVATFRKDGTYSDGRKPDFIERGSPEEDAKRRDFTINGLFYDPVKETIYDFVGGQEDLKKKILRAIGSPAERFAEDRLRMLRAVRFSLRFDLTIEEATYKAIQETSSLLFPSVSVERVFQELDKMPKKAEGFTLLFQLGLLEALFKDKMLQPHLIKNLAFLDPETPLIIFLALLFPQDPLVAWEEIAAFFKCSHISFKHITLLDKARRLKEEASLQEWAHYFAEDEALFYCRIWADFNQLPSSWLDKRLSLYENLKEDVRRLVEKRPLIDASLLKKEGILPGPQMGKLLKKAEEIAINERISSSTKVLEKLKTLRLWFGEEELDR